MLSGNEVGRLNARVWGGRWLRREAGLGVRVAAGCAADGAALIGAGLGSGGYGVWAGSGYRRCQLGPGGS